MRALLILNIILWSTIFPVMGAEIVLNGWYQGKDLYVQNPFSKELKQFCTEAVYVNDQLFLENPSTSAFRINLSHLAINETVAIKIHHREGCSPRILNPEVILPSGNFEITSPRAGQNSISWISKNEASGGRFIIERKMEGPEWEQIKEVSGKGRSQSYEVHIAHNRGENIYRIKFVDSQGAEAFSENLQFIYKEVPISFSPKEASTKLYLSSETEYVITDITGRKYKHGKGKIITIHNLKPGEYLLHIQDRAEPFTKTDN